MTIGTATTTPQKYNWYGNKSKVEIRCDRRIKSPSVPVTRSDEIRWRFSLPIKIDAVGEQKSPRVWLALKSLSKGNDSADENVI